MRAVTLIVMSVLLAGCSALGIGSGNRFAGYYAWGFETDSFTLCGNNESWWLAADKAGLGERYRALGVNDYQPVYVVIEGSVGPEGAFGHMGAYRRELSGTRVLGMDPLRSGPCG
jgi:hypothetical protein